MPKGEILKEMKKVLEIEKVPVQHVCEEDRDLFQFLPSDGELNHFAHKIKAI